MILPPCPFCGEHLSEPMAVEGVDYLARFHPGSVDDRTCVLSGRGFREDDLPGWCRRVHVEQLREALVDVEWSGAADAEDGGFLRACPWCGEIDGDGHDRSCRLAIALAASAPPAHDSGDDA